jgi:predicted GTPase
VERAKVVIMGAAGRDFHDFNVVYRDDPDSEVVAFTATQIPGIDDRRYPPELSGELYPDGIPIVSEDELEHVVYDNDVDIVIFSYSDVPHETVMHAASRAMSAGADFGLIGPRGIMLESTKPVIAVCAVRTGCGKSQTTRAVAAALDELGLTTVVVRHPMPYGDLAAQRVQRFASYDDLARHHTTIEEREEYEPHLEAGRVVYAGVDYEAILREAEQEADVVLWDGGNNDLPFFLPDLYIVVADPLRPGHETRFHPGETNLRMADVVVINKIDSATDEDLAAVVETIESVNPEAEILTARSDLFLDGPSVGGKRVVVVEDGPTLTHGGMTYGAGVVAARRFGAAEMVDPRTIAIGSIHTVLERYPDLLPLVPAMGYGERQMAELKETLDRVDADIVLAATPIDLGRLLELDKPVTRVRYELAQVEGRPLAEVVAEAIETA